MATNRKRTEIRADILTLERVQETSFDHEKKASCPDETISQSQIEIYEEVLCKKPLSHLLVLEEFALSLHPRHPTYFHISNACNYTSAR